MLEGGKEELLVYRTGFCSVSKKKTSIRLAFVASFGFDHYDCRLFEPKIKHELRIESETGLRETIEKDYWVPKSDEN